MAGNTVPGLDNAPQFSTNVPGVALPRRQEFTELGQAYKGLGTAVEGAAQHGGEIYDEIQQQHDLSTARTSSVDAGVAHAQQLQTLKMTSPDGFVRDADTGEIDKNADGSQRTIAQEYWDWANSDYQTRQDGMSPRAAAMFRQEMQPQIGANTRHLQNTQLDLQAKASDGAVAASMSTLAHDNDRSPWPDMNPYYGDTREDGSVNLRGNTDKINDQLRTLKLWTTQQGPSHGKMGVHDPNEVATLTGQRLSQHAESWMQSTVTDIMENDTPRDHKNRVSTTALQQVGNLLDVVEGKDPQSAQARAKGLPTVNSSLTTDQIDKWRNQLNGMRDGAQKIDRSEYELALEQMKAATKSGQYTFDGLVKSPEFSHLVHAAEPLGITPDQQMKNMSELFGNAAKTAGHTGVSDLVSDAAKRTQVEQNLRAFQVGWPQYASMFGAKYTGGMGNAILGEAGKSAYSQLEEESKQYREDPAKFAAQMSSGPQDPIRGTRYRSTMMKGVEDKLFSDPSIFAPLNTMSNGKPVISNAIKEMRRIGSMGFGAGYDVAFLSKNDYQSWSNKIEKSANPEQVESMFQRLKKLEPEHAGTVMDQLVKVGGLDPRYQTAQNLPTSVARIAAYSDILSKGAAVEAFATSEGGETRHQVMQRAMKATAAESDFADRVYGADSPGSAKAKTALWSTWASAFADAKLKKLSDSDATTAADARVRAQIPPVANVQAQHNWLGFQFGSTGPASKVQFTRSDLSPDQQQTVQSNLLKAQQLGELQKHEAVPAPIEPGAYDFNKRVTPAWIAEHPFVWRPVGHGPNAAYRMQYQGMNADGSPNGRGYDLRVFDSKGNPVYYDVKESDALKKQGP